MYHGEVWKAEYDDAGKRFGDDVYFSENLLAW